MRRLADTLYKIVAYLSLPFEYPARFFLLLRLVLINRSLAGELMRLSAHRKWFETAAIESVIDVGSHIGAFAFAMRQILPQVKIYAFEPLPDSYHTLVKNLEKFGAFHAFQTALGKKSGSVTFWRSQFSASSSALPMSDLHKRAYPRTAHSMQVAVPVAKLDDYLPRMELARRTLLKIDVQGYELEVLRGGMATLKVVDFILVEVSFKTLYENQALFTDVYRFLDSQGFSYAGSLETATSPLDGSILQADALFVRERAVEE